MRIILFTGKGGVGKTTLSAATAALLSTLGKRVLVISVDPAHSLSDVLEHEIGPEPTEIRPNLFAQEVDVYYSIEKYWGKLKEYLKSLLKWQGVEEILAEEMAVLPGMEEVSAFLWINSHAESREYDVIIMDLAPTGETLRFLSLPNAVSWWITKILPLQRKLMKFIRPAAKMVTDMPLPEEETYDAMEDLFCKVFNLYYLLQNPKISTVRLVINPEKMVLRETKRAYTYLHLFEFAVDAIFVNKVAKKEDPLYAIQKKYLPEIEQSFYPTPLFYIPYHSHEILGLENLLELAKLIYKDKDPGTIFYQDKPFHIENKNGHSILKLHLKEVPKEKLEIYHSGEELTVRIGNFKKHFFLPRLLINKRVKTAKLTPPYLEITFC